MGKALTDASKEARAVFEEVDEALGQNLFKLMRDGPDGELRLTENAQPAIMANALAVFTALAREGGVDLVKAADFVAGHSLGEYSALCAAGSFDLATGAPIAGPPQRPLPRINLEVRDGVIYATGIEVKTI
jgi:[acyl-carrier-protein] S-malonyltransferase